MELNLALFLYALIVICLIIFFIRIQIKAFSAVIMSLIIGLIILNFMAPPHCIEPWNSSCSSTAIYYFIQVFTFFAALVIYFIKG